MSQQPRIGRDRRRVTLIAMGVAVAMAAVAAGYFRLAYDGGRDPWGLRQLADAVALESTRPIEAHLATFPYLPPPRVARGATRGHPRAAVLAAVADVEDRARRIDTPESRAASGVARLVAGDVDNALEALEAAAERDPGRPEFFVNLSAAYLEKGTRNSSAGDLARGLAAAVRAGTLDGGRADAHFNRALALERLGLDQQALSAWSQLRAADGSGWGAEAADRALRLEAKLRGQGAATPAADSQALREHLEDDVLPRWGQAVQAGRHGDAHALLTQAEHLGAVLAEGGGDLMAVRECQRLRVLYSQDRQATVLTLSRGFAAFGRARRAYRSDQQHDAAALMDEASRHFRRAGSPFSHWGRIYRAIYLRNSGDVRAAVLALDVGAERLPDDAHHLRGRWAWANGVALNESGRFDLGREQLAAAVAHYEEAGENDNLTATRTVLAETDTILGNRSQAWATLLTLLHEASRRPAGGRYSPYWAAAELASAEGLHEAAMEFEAADIATAQGPRRLAEAHLMLARTLVRLNDPARARASLDQAGRAVMRIEDSSLRARNAADVRIARAELLAADQPGQALVDADAALAYVTPANPAIRLARLLSVRARAKERLGDIDGARRDLFASLGEFERKRLTLSAPLDRMQAFEHERAAYKELIRLEALVRRDPAAALRVVEQSREGAATPSLGLAGPLVDPTRDYRRLPPDLALVYYETLDEVVLAWVVTDERWTHFQRPLPLAALTTTINRMARQIREGAGLGAIRSDGGRLFSELIAPALALAGDRPKIFFVPDGPLHGLSFAALTDATGAALIESRTVAVAPSFATLMSASGRLAGLAADDVLAVGDGHDTRTSGLARLPLANDEAVAVGDVYPIRTVLTGSNATRARVVAQSRTVLHFAGHTTLNRAFPLLSRLLLAPDPQRKDSGSWRAVDIAAHRFERTRVVVLATCDGASGRVIGGEGLVSVAGAFISSGVPAVVASLWPLDDRDAHRLFTAFHRELRRRGDPASALRATQLSILRQRADTPVRAWGGVMSFGGTNATASPGHKKES